MTARQDRATGKLQYYQFNGHGDVVGLVDEQGTPLNTYTYDIWGGPVETEETVPNVMRYAGEYWDETTGLQYLRARWYDPGTARFIGEDTYEGELGNPLSQNIYTYVHNNPLIYVDPSGNYCVSQNGQWAKAGSCTSDSSIYMGDDSDFIGRPIINKGVVRGYLGKNGAYTERVAYSGNYWAMHQEDYLYILWINTTDPDFWPSLDRGTQIVLRQKLLGNYMQGQIELGFPDFRAGFNAGVDLITRGSYSKIKKALTLASIAKGIPKKLINETADATYINLDLFKNGKYGSATLEKDRAINSGAGTHGGSYYKLKIRGESGYWSITKEGKILRRKNKRMYEYDNRKRDL